VCCLSHFDFSSDDSSSSEEDENAKCKKGDFTGLCLMTKGGSSRNVSDSDVSEDLSFKSLSLKVAKLENALCNKDKLLCKVFPENKKLNLEFESSFSEIASIQSVHDDMSDKPCDNCKMIMLNCADLWLVHAQVASQLDGAKLELGELKAYSLLLGACFLQHKSYKGDHIASGITYLPTTPMTAKSSVGKFNWLLSRAD
jgi:hypothetical protein